MRQPALDLIKWIALVTMTLDHLRFIWPALEPLSLPGRIAFPAFAIVIAAHALRQGQPGASAWRQMAWLIVFAVVSQWPYWLLFEREQGNILLTLACGLGLICGIRIRIRIRMPGWRGTVIAVASVGLSVVVPVSYGLLGVLLPFAFLVALQSGKRAAWLLPAAVAAATPAATHRSRQTGGPLGGRNRTFDRAFQLGDQGRHPSRAQGPGGEDSRWRMKTDDLIALLASEVAPVDRLVVAKRFATALLCGLAGALLLIVTAYGIRADLAVIATTPLFWAKLALPATLLFGALLLTTRMARPGTRVGRSWVLLAAPVVIVWGAALAILISAPADARMPLLLGSTWRECLANIALLSVPAFIAAFWALRGLAPTRPHLAGGAAGLLAGSVAALAYSLHCPEMAVPFWALWYLLGMWLPGVLGALLGPRLLRW